MEREQAFKDRVRGEYMVPLGVAEARELGLYDLLRNTCFKVTDVAKPVPGPGQVLIKIGGAGVCHSDLHLMEEDFGFKPPFTLGHENAGWIAQLGDGVSGFKEGDAVAVRSLGLRSLSRLPTLDGELL
ncbi:MAG TPA: alcohol dehydrogenase catalytic domain-containing protein [Pyrinomonadaceae bacterium]|nr:alcohol dehydrogenase catalytic domain-containing protein [Pyrinomonadaceae bacterium]